MPTGTGNIWPSLDVIKHSIECVSLETRRRGALGLLAHVLLVRLVCRGRHIVRARAVRGGHSLARAALNHEACRCRRSDLWFGIVHWFCLLSRLACLRTYLQYCVGAESLEARRLGALSLLARVSLVRLVCRRRYEYGSSAVRILCRLAGAVLNHEACRCKRSDLWFGVVH